MTTPDSAYSMKLCFEAWGDVIEKPENIDILLIRYDVVNMEESKCWGIISGKLRDELREKLIRKSSAAIKTKRHKNETTLRDVDTLLSTQSSFYYRKMD